MLNPSKEIKWSPISLSFWTGVACRNRQKVSCQPDKGPGSRNLQGYLYKMAVHHHSDASLCVSHCFPPLFG